VCQRAGGRRRAKQLEINRITMSIEAISVIFNIILVFQWMWDRAREKTVVNQLVSARRTALRRGDRLVIVDQLDATLATLGERNPFLAQVEKIIEFIKAKIESEKNSPLSFEVKGKNAIPSPFHENPKK
jgi:hypothetical protein